MSLILYLISTPYKFIRRKNILFLFAIILSVSNFYAQQKTDTIVEKTFWQKLWGNDLEDGLVFMPIGTHTVEPDIFDVWYTGYSYKNLELAVFKNSYSDWTLGLTYKRVLRLSNKFNLNYSGGIVYGYRGKLQDVDYIPFHDSFLFTGNISPIIGIDIDYRISKKISIYSSVSPLIIIYGIKYYFK